MSTRQLNIEVIKITVPSYQSAIERVRQHHLEEYAKALHIAAALPAPNQTSSEQKIGKKKEKRAINRDRSVHFVGKKSF